LARLITKTLPCRLITREPGLFFRDLIELRTFTVASLGVRPENLLSM
jgi:hypothetical protein